MARRRSRQKKHGGGKFASEKQRRYMWAVAPAAAKKWAHNKVTNKGDWRKRKKRSVKNRARRRGR